MLQRLCKRSHSLIKELHEHELLLLLPLSYTHYSVRAKVPQGCLQSIICWQKHNDGVQKQRCKKEKISLTDF